MKNEAVYDFLRAAALDALVILAFAGRIPRAEVIEYFRGLFHGKLQRIPSFVWGELACCAVDLRASELLEQVRQACADDLVDPLLADFADLEREMNTEPEVNPRSTMITDAIAEMKEWSVFQAENFWPAKPVNLIDPNWGLPSLPTMETYEPPEPTRRLEPKIGRNEPCPCGSGKKYKKCCGYG